MVLLSRDIANESSGSRQLASRFEYEQCLRVFTSYVRATQKVKVSNNWQDNCDENKKEGLMLILSSHVVYSQLPNSKSTNISALDEHGIEFKTFLSECRACTLASLLRTSGWIPKCTHSSLSSFA